MDLLNGRWRFQVIRDHPYHKGPILTLNRYAHDRDLMNAILQVLHDTFSPSSPLVMIEPTPVARIPPVIVTALVGTPTSEEKEDARFKEIPNNGRGRKAGETFSALFTCPCGKTFRYEKAFQNHQASCPSVKNDVSGRGRKARETFSGQFTCPCGKTFKYKKACGTHQETCQKKV